MSQKNDKIKKMMITKAIISASTPLIIAMLVIIVISVVISSILNFITYLDGTVNEDDQSNVPFVVSKYTADATIDDDGNINSSMSANDIWATVKENDGRLEQYLEDSKELQKLIHAEAMSDFLDTRANPDAPINWDEILENPDSTKIQGIIKLKREMSGEGAFTMTYVSPDTFQAYIDKYNETGSEEDKKEALKHFTIEKLYYSSSGGNYTIGENNSNEGNTNSDSSSEEWCWPADGEVISEFGSRKHPITGEQKQHNGIDIGVAEGTNVYAADAGTVIGVGFDENGGNIITIDHGNGYITKYMHNSVIKAKVGDKVEKGQVIALSGSTGKVTGAHLHFQVEYNGTPINPRTVRYSNGMGGDGSVLDSCGFYAKVATWNEETVSVSNLPDVKTYNMTSTRIDYKSLVEGYTMPFEYLWDFLMIGGEKEFVLELADLAYDSKLEITIHDNLTTNTSITTENYERETKIKTHDVKVEVEYSKKVSGKETTVTETVSADQTFGPGYQRQSYETVKNIVTKTNTLDVSLTKADVWFVDYERTYAYTMPAEEVKDSPEETIEGTEFNANPDETSETDGYGYAKKFKEETEEKYKKQYDNVSAEVTKVISDYWYRMAGGTRKVQNKLEKTTYVPGVAKVKEKTDPNSAEPNFVTIYLKEEHEKNASNIYSAYQWLYQCLENNDDTKNMVDLTKYLLYIVTEGTLDEVTDFRDAVDIN